MRNNKHLELAGLAFLVGLPAFGMGGPAQAQQSPFAGNAVNTDLAPDGSHLRADYQAAGGTRDRASSAAALDGGGRLPDGFTLGKGSTAHIASARTARASAAPVGQSAELESAPGTSAADKLITIYPITYQGLPLTKGSDYLTVTTADGQLLHTRTRGLPDNVDATDAGISAETAVAIGEDALEARFAAADSIQASTPTLEVLVAADRRGQLAWAYSLRNNSLSAPVALKVWVAAAGLGAPDILRVENRIHHAHHGQVTSNIWDGSPLQPTVNLGLPDLQVNRSNRTDGGENDTVLTGEDGRYGFASGGGRAVVIATPSGPFSLVHNAAGPPLIVGKSGGTNDSLDLDFGAIDDLSIAQTTAFHWTNIAQRMVAGYLDPENDNVDLRQLQTIVNINDVCNAFYDDDLITTNYFQAGVFQTEDPEVSFTCPNTAYVDVVLHEDGHAVDDAKGGILDGGYSEGFGDAMTILQTRQSCLGRDFLAPNTCLRPADEVILWPPETDEDGNDAEGVHAIGRRYAGFTWELVQQLRQTYSDDSAFDIATRITLGAAHANPSDIPDAVHLSFVVDDDDGDLSNGTPHFEELKAAAESRNIPTMVDSSAVAFRIAKKWRRSKSVY